jgi:hypothetical protein
VTSVVSEKPLFHEPLFAAYNELAAMLRDLPDSLSREILSRFVKDRKDTFKTRVDDYADWVTAKKRALEEYREYYLRLSLLDD